LIHLSNNFSKFFRNDQTFQNTQKDTSILFSKTGENPGDSQKSGNKISYPFIDIII